MLLINRTRWLKNTDQGIYQGLFKTIRLRSMPAHLGECVAGETFARAESGSFQSAQSIRVFLNGSLQGSVALADDKQSYELQINESDQHVGRNLFRFEYAYTSSPKETGTSADDRELAVAWFNLWLSD